MTPISQLPAPLRAVALGMISLAAIGAALVIALVLHPDLAPRGLDNLCRWDCGWYRSIADGGYQVDPKPGDLQANYAFYPAFPGAARLVMLLTGLGFAHAALLLNAFCTMLFAWLALANREVLLLRSDRDTAIFVLAFLLSPWSLYNHIPYTEMSFNLMVLATFVAWRREQFVAAALCGFVLTATRVTGIFLPLMLLLELVLRERWRVLDLLRAPDARFRALAIMPLGGLAFFIYLGFHVGDPLASFRIQASWNQAIRNPIETLIGGALTKSRDGYLSLVAFIVPTLLVLAGWWRGRVPFALAMTATLIACSAVMSGLMSTPRHTLSFFPVYLLVPMLPRLLQWLVLACLALVQGVFVYFWVLGNGALV